MGEQGNAGYDIPKAKIIIDAVVRDPYRMISHASPSESPILPTFVKPFAEFSKGAVI